MELYNMIYKTLCFVALFQSGILSKLVDLSHDYNVNMIRYPLYTPFEFQMVQRGWSQIVDGKIWIEYNKIGLFEHMGTHMDAPSHYNLGPGPWRLHEIPIDRFIGEAVVIDISDRADLKSNPNAKPRITDITKWEEEHGKIKDGSIVFIYSGWDKYWDNRKDYIGTEGNDTTLFQFPGIGKEVSEWLVNNRKISGIGVDTLTLDAGDDLPHHYAHIAILSANIYGLENVNNLGKIPKSGARVYVMPMNIHDGSGAPCRVIAEYDREDFSKAISIKESSISGLIMINLVFILKMTYN